MTKTLTEQFMDGSFECNVYYCQTKYDGLKLLLLYHDGCEHGYAQKFGECEDYPHKDIIEVLAPVPSYDEFVQQRDFVKDHQKVLIENMNLKLKVEEYTEVMKIILRNIEKPIWGRPEPLEMLQIIKSQVNGLLKKWGVK